VTGREDDDAAAGCRCSPFPLPPDCFDPLGAMPEELAAFGLPARPDKHAHPDLSRVWQRMLGPPLRLVAPVFGVVPDQPLAEPSPSGPPDGALSTPAPNGFRPSPSARQGAPSMVVPRGPSRNGTSRNWSGAVVAPDNGERFTQIWGGWRVPEPALPTGADAALPPSVQHRCSIWVGLGGHKRHSRSLPQTGITQAVKDGRGQLEEGWSEVGQVQARTWAWYQWWVRDRRFGPVDLMNFAAAPGEEVTCCLTVETGTAVALHLKNQTSGLCVNFRCEAPDPLAPVDGTAAEWIVERPTHLKTDRLYPLPAYGSVVFGDCVAETRSTPNSAAGTARDLRGARLIRMYDVLHAPHRAALISVPERTGDGALRVSRRDGGAGR